MTRNAEAAGSAGGAPMVSSEAAPMRFVRSAMRVKYFPRGMGMSQ